VTYLIDGYNLLHAVGLANRSLPAKGLERARTRLLDWLADAIRGRGELLRVVFDAQNSPAASDESDHRGVRVRFAFRRTADELIAELVRAEPHPARLAVVSNDTQVQDAGRRRGCGVLSCQEFVDRMIQAPVAHAPGSPARAAGSPPTEKPEQDATANELAAWLEVFSRPKRKKP